MTDIFDSVVLITSTDEKNKKFGSGFAFLRKQDETWILTCAHVVEDVGGEEHIQVGGKNAKVLACGKPDEVDMAVLEVADLDIPPLKLGLVGAQNLECTITGFASLTSRNQMRRAEPLQGTGSQMKFETREGVRIEAWRLWIDSKVLLEGGYSGSPVLESASKTVFAVTSHSSHEGDTGYAVSLTNLPRIWPAMPADLVQEKPPEIPKPEHETPELLKGISRPSQAPAKTTAEVSAPETPPSSQPPEVIIPGAGAYRHCDREDQDNDFRALFEQYSREAPGEPQFYLIHGDEGECHDSFVQRLCDTHIKHYAARVFGGQRTDVFLLQPAWSDREVDIAERDLNFNLLKALLNKSGERLDTPTLSETLAQLLSRHTGTVVVLCYDLYAQNWNKHTPLLLQRYCDACRTAYRQARAIHSQAAHCLVFVNLIYPGPEQWQRFSWWERFTYSSKRIEGQIQTWRNGLTADYRCQVVEKLCPVTWNQARECIEKLVPHENERLDHLQTIFGSAKQARMASVEAALRELIRQQRDNAL